MLDAATESPASTEFGVVGIRVFKACRFVRRSFPYLFPPAGRSGVYFVVAAVKDAEVEFADGGEERDFPEDGAIPGPLDSYLKIPVCNADLDFAGIEPVSVKEIDVGAI